MSKFNEGIDAALKQLKSTAEDYEQMAQRLGNLQHRSDREQRELQELQSKAQLLRGQMMHIDKLKQ